MPSEAGNGSQILLKLEIGTAGSSPQEVLGVKPGPPREQDVLSAPEPHPPALLLQNFYVCDLVLLSPGTVFPAEV